MYVYSLRSSPSSLPSWPYEPGPTWCFLGFFSCRCCLFGGGGVGVGPFKAPRDNFDSNRRCIDKDTFDLN